MSKSAKIELGVEWITSHDKNRPSTGTIMELLNWSHRQSVDPDDIPE